MKKSLEEHAEQAGTLPGARLTAEQTEAAFEIEVFYDGACPLCVREMRMLEARDRHQRIRFVDIASQDFEPRVVGVTWEQLMAELHGRLPDGTLLRGVEVFRRLYAAIGFGPVVRWTRLPGVSQALDAAYGAFARNRLRLTGRCGDGACSVPADRPTGSERIGRPHQTW